MGNEGHAHVRRTAHAQGPIDFGLVLVAQDTVGANVVGYLGERHLFVGFAARARGSALGVDDHRVGLHETRAQKRQDGQHRGRGVAAGIGNQPGRSQFVCVVGGLWHGIDSLGQQRRRGMSEAVPLRVLVCRQPEAARQIHHARARCQHTRRQLDRNLGRRAQKDHVHLAQVGLALLVGKASQIRRRSSHGQSVAQTLAGPLVAGHQPDGKVRMAGQDAGQFHPGIAGNADDAGPPW